jgi:hypothetical protein
MAADQQFPKSPMVDLIDLENFTFHWSSFRILRPSFRGQEPISKWKQDSEEAGIGRIGGR